MGALGGAAVSAAGSIFGSDKAADAQVQAAKIAAKTQKEMFDKTQQNLSPFIQGGAGIFNTLQNSIPGLTADFAPTMEQLEATPGYQFTLEEGLKAAQNSYAAQGLGQSGAAMKGAEQYATGLASQTFQQQFQNYLTQQSQKYNMLMGGSQVGANAAAGLGQISSQVGQGLANTYGNMGQGQAAAYTTMGGAVANLGNALGGKGLANNWNNFGLGGSNGSGVVGPGGPDSRYEAAGAW